MLLLWLKSKAYLTSAPQVTYTWQTCFESVPQPLTGIANRAPNSFHWACIRYRAPGRDHHLIRSGWWGDIYLPLPYKILLLKSRCQCDSYPSNSSFWSPFLPLQEMQNLRLQINLSFGACYCQTIGSASRRLLNSPAQLPKPSEAWHATKGSAVGTAGGPCQLQIRISSSATLQLPTPFCQERTWRRKDQKQESGCLCPGPPPVYRLLPPAPLRLHTWKGHCLSHIQSPFWFSPQIQGPFSELWYYVHNPWHREVLQCLQKDGKENEFGNKGASEVDHQWARAEGGLNVVESTRSPRQTRGLHTFQDVLAPPRPSNNGIKAIGPKSAVYWLGDLGQVKLSVPQFPHL